MIHYFIRNSSTEFIWLWVVVQVIYQLYSMATARWSNSQYENRIPQRLNYATEQYTCPQILHQRVSVTVLYMLRPLSVAALRQLSKTKHTVYTGQCSRFWIVVHASIMQQWSVCIRTIQWTVRLSVPVYHWFSPREAVLARSWGS